MTAGPPLRIAIVAGEESGDLLGADIVRALASMTGREVRLVGLGGRHLQSLGLESLFDASDIALMGLSAVVKDLPRLIRRIGQTARAIVAEAPDILITIDSPDFALRVAKKVRSAKPDVPVVHYVCPSVWAWRPGRAPAMKAYIDHILCLLPFEPAALARLGGPPGTFVGHRLTSEVELQAAARIQRQPRDLSSDRVKTLLLLPGSRRGEVSLLLEPFRQTVSILNQRGHRLRLLLPTVPHVAETVKAVTSTWAEQPEILLGAAEKWLAFGQADAALIASGTVSLELALVGVPLISCYKLDPIMRIAQRLITTWSALLPNLIADRPIAQEYFDRYVRPEMLARTLEQLFTDTDLRAWQKNGFAEVAQRMATDRPAGEIAAGIVLDMIGRRSGTPA